MKITQLYESLLTKESDIKDHLAILAHYASLCEHVTEFGVRTGNSTAAFLYGKPKTLVSYDIADFAKYKQYQEMAPEVNFTFIKKDTRFVNIEETDLIFFDTIHSYNQVKEELTQHAHKARRYLIFHDTETYGEVGQCPRTLNILPGSLGILHAIREYMNLTKFWKIDYETKACNGLMVLRNIRHDHILAE